MPNNKQQGSFQQVGLLVIGEHNAESTSTVNKLCIW
jgi:hypothetical protein